MSTQTTSHVVSYGMQDIGHEGAFRARIDGMLVDGTYKYVSTRKMNTDATILEVAGDHKVLGFSEGGWSSTLVIQSDESIAVIEFNPNSKLVSVYSHTHHDAIAFLEDILSRAPTPPEPDKNTLPVSFWMHSAQGPVSRKRQITIETWPNIEQNYPARTREHLKQVFEVKNPESGGKLMLYHGVPGTGKTYTIRALAKHWADWCDIHYIVDPENLFGNAQYLMHVLLEVDNFNEDGKWRLLVMEDTDEFLRVDAKNRAGQALSRLLNVADGILGQGLKVLVLITTNEPLNNLHPAISRQGRCLAEIEFPTFSPEEARDWIARHEVENAPTVRDEMTLAELYDMANQSNKHIKGVKEELDQIGQYL